jgi:hypothetical protein
MRHGNNQLLDARVIVPEWIISLHSTVVDIVIFLVLFLVVIFKLGGPV